MRNNEILLIICPMFTSPTFDHGTKKKEFNAKTFVHVLINNYRLLRNYKSRVKLNTQIYLILYNFNNNLNLLFTLPRVCDLFFFSCHQNKLIVWLHRHWFTKYKIHKLQNDG